MRGGGVAERTGSLLGYELIAVIRFAPDGNVLCANPFACETYGYDEETFRRLTVYDIDPSLPAESWQAYFAELSVDGTARFVREHRKRDGTRFPAMVISHHVRSAGEESIVAFLQDITLQLQAERSLRRAMCVIDRIWDPVYWVASDGSFLYVNPAAYRFLGYEKEELLRRSLFDINPQLTVEDFAEIWSNVRKRGKRLLETVHRTREGRDVPVEIAVSRIDFEDEDFNCAFVRDITERKQAEIAFRESEYFLLKSQEVSRLGSYKLDFASGKWISSRMLDDLFGISDGYPKDVDGWLCLVAPDQREEMRDYLEKHVIAGRNRFEKEYRILRHADRRERWVNGLGELEFDEDGKAVRMIGTIQDITERKQAEKERETLKEQLRQAQKMESIGRLAGGVAHDFNNMLTIILGYSELMRMRLAADDPLRKFLSEIEKAAEHSRDITGQLLAFSRKQHIAPRVVNLNDLLADLQMTISRLIGEDIRLRVHPGKELWDVRVDPVQFKQVLVNLAVNARDAMPGGGQLAIVTGNELVEEAALHIGAECAPGEYVTLEMTDTGVGMDPETLANIFEPFFTTKEVGKGTGLGLSTVYGIVRQNEGMIDVRSEPGRWTTFRIRLPRWKECGVEEAAPEEAGGAPAEAASGRILLVEDDEGVRCFTLQMLETLGYTVAVAETPHDALSALKDGNLPVDLLMTDVVMPGMNGRELWKKAKTVRQGIGVLFMSGYSRDVIVKRGILEEGVHFLAKPFSRKDLSRAVEEALAAVRERGKGVS
ncbi:MAG: sensor histidine kinase response regulator [Deltaproteobacteria bacterium]|nr:sensor histidine kinase response regulator [Deltaproteobacteria bacterium]